MKNTKTKLITSVLMLAVAVVLATTTTFAWFSMNSEVETTGINMDVTTQGDLLISNAAKGTYGSTFALAAFDGTLVPITAAEKNSETGALTFNNLDASAADAGSYYSFDIYFKSITPYEVYLSELDLAVADMTVTNSTEYSKGIKAMDYYVYNDTNVYKITDITFNDEGTQVISCNVNGTAGTVSAGALTAPVAAAFTIADKAVTGITSDGNTVIAPGEVIDANPLNAMRIAFVADKDNSNIFDINKGAAGSWSAREGINIAHDYYNAVAASVGKPSIPADYETEQVQPAATEATQTKIVTLTDSGTTNPEGLTYYTAKVTVIIWIEGSDADCIASIANKTITGSLNLHGVYVQPAN